MTESERSTFENKQAIGLRPLVRGGLWCAGGVLVVAVILYAAFWLPYRNPAENQPYPLPILPRPPEAGQVPAQGYEWVDRKAGIVQIPVEDAMTIAAERLPVRKGSAASTQAKQSPTDAGSGRVPRTADRR